MRLGGDGHGRLRSRRVQIRVAGRAGIAHRGRKATVLLPGPTGAVAKSERTGPKSTIDAGEIPAPRDRRAG
jgi:hypothetical protein